MGKIHGTPKIKPMWHKFNKFDLENSIEPRLATMLAIKVLYSFPTCFKGCIVFIHLIFTFWRTLNPSFFYNFNKFGEFKTMGAKKYSYNDWRRFSNLETIGIMDKFCMTRLVLCAIQSTTLTCEHGNIFWWNIPYHVNKILHEYSLSHY